jgi:hypothetical protein
MPHGFLVLGQNCLLDPGIISKRFDEEFLLILVLLGCALVCWENVVYEGVQ